MRNIFTLIFLVSINTAISQEPSLKSEVHKYLNSLDIEGAEGYKTVVIIDFNKSNYVSEHWINKLINTNYKFPDILFVISSKGEKAIRNLIINKSNSICFDPKQTLRKQKFYSGTSLLITNNNMSVLLITELSMGNAYQERLQLFRSTKKDKIE